MAVKDELEEINLFDEGKPEVTVAPEADDDPTKDDFVMPEKFVGKSVEDVVKSYQNLEQDHGRKSNEIGELRKLTDDILRQKVEPVKDDSTSQSNEVGFDELIEDPQAAIDKVLSTNPRLAALEANIQTSAQATAHNAILKRHSDADTVVASPEFQQWLMENPGRQRTFADASNNLDIDMADSMLDIYKSGREAKTNEAVETRDTNAKESLKKATNEKGNKNSGGRKPIYKRKELIHMKVHDPQRWESMSDDIRQAYADGRVR